MSNDTQTQHGPVRQLVERAIEEWDAVQMSPYGEEVGAAEYELDVVRTLADAHDAAHAALVEAAEAAEAWVNHAESYVMGTDPRPHLDKGDPIWDRLRAAIAAVKGGQDGK